MQISFNSKPIITGSKSLGELLGEYHLSNKTGIAVALNSSVVTRAEWSKTDLKENDQILIITATQGG